MKKFSKTLRFNEYLLEGATSGIANKIATNPKSSDDIKKKGLEFTNNIKKTDSVKAEWKHMPCYQYVYSYMKQYIPNLNPSVMNDFKMAYKKDISSLKSVESLQLAKQALQVPTTPETMRGLEYVNNKYKIGNIVSVDEAKIGDAVSFWVFELIEFSRIQKNYSFTETESKFNNWVKKNKLDVNKLPEWLIEGVTLKFGHYAIISDIDSKYLYLSSSGEKRGCNGIWNGVPKSECSDNFTRILKADMKKFQNMSFDKLLFQSTDVLSNKRTQLLMRSYILNFIK